MTKPTADEILDSLEEEKEWLWQMWKKLPKHCGVKHVPRLLDIKRRCELALRQIDKTLKGG